MCVGKTRITPRRSETMYDDVSTDSDSEIPIQKVVIDMLEHGTDDMRPVSHAYTGYTEPPNVQASFQKVTLISTLHRCMFGYTSPVTQDTYLAKVTCVEHPVDATECVEDKSFINGYEMESLVYHILKGDPCIPERVAWKEVVPPNEMSALVYIDSAPVELDFRSWAQHIDYDYSHFCVIVMKTRQNSVTLNEYARRLYKSHMSPLDVSISFGNIITRIINKLRELHTHHSFVHCDLKSDNVLINTLDDTDITFIDFDLSSIHSKTSVNQVYYYNATHLLEVSNKKQGLLFDIYRLCTSITTISHVPLLHNHQYFSSLHAILCMAPYDTYVDKMEREDSQYNFLNDMKYFKQWSDNVEYNILIDFISKNGGNELVELVEV
jgi:hypothetical protein